jgi:rRNA maturation endonuclease Nob1
MLSLFIALIGAVTLWYILLPLWRPAPVPTATQASSSETLPERRDNLLRQLKELEFDQSMGKLDASDYEQMRADLSSETADVLAELENAATADTTSHTSTRNLDLEVELEIQIARARRRVTSRVDDSWRCAECGRQMAGSDRFCASCGARRTDEQHDDEQRSNERASSV